ncbi:Gfo/Idh/MocA family protein [Acidobacteriota bacterium]
MPLKKHPPVSVVLVGIGGMGYFYLRTLFDDFSPDRVCVKAVVDPFPESSRIVGEVRQRGIPIYDSLEDYFPDAGSAIDLVIVSSPIQYHVDQSIRALEKGSRVLCEKPLCATIQEADRLIRASSDHNGRIEIGYQWSFTPAIQDFKQDVLAGRFGRPVRLKTLCFWPRDMNYFNRNHWAGRLKDDSGLWVLDSPAGNAMAHFLHNMFYVLGHRIDASAVPVEVAAEASRLYPIENFDTISSRIFTEEGVELLFFASHAVPENRGPLFEFEFEEAKVVYEGPGNEIWARWTSGIQKSYGNPEVHLLRKLSRAVEGIFEDIPVLCPPEAARSQTLCVNGIQDSISCVKEFPKEKIIRTGDQLWSTGLADLLDEAYQKNKLPSEIGDGGTRSGKVVDLNGYTFFPGGKKKDGGIKIEE